MRWRWIGYAGSVLMLACSSDATSSSLESSGAKSPGGSNDGPPAAGADGTPPAEREVESSYQSPVATERYVWLPNPTSGRVAYVDVNTLEVRTIEAGNGPTFVAPVPAQTDDATVVINTLSHDATLLRADKNGITKKTFEIADSANAIAFSSDGHYAIVWTDWRKIQPAPKETDGFQDLTILDLQTGTSTIVAVGYRPVSVGFAANEPRAYAVTQDGVALINTIGTALVTSNVAISDSPNEDPGTRDVFVTPDGNTALIRRDGSPIVTMVVLSNGIRTPITLSGNVTDLDVNEEGDRAIAVIREKSEVAVLRVAELSANPGAFATYPITGETIGSVAIAPGGKKAFLYTNASSVERVTLFNLDDNSFRTVRLNAPVLAAFSSPDAAHAVVLHTTTETPTGKTGAFSLLPVDHVLPAKIVSTEAAPLAVAIDNDRVVVAERDDTRKLYGVYLGRTPQLMVKRYSLASPPLSVGIVPTAHRAYIAQAHPEGRLTFLDLDTGVARTLTGFELSARVVDGSKP